MRIVQFQAGEEGTLFILMEDGRMFVATPKEPEWEPIALPEHPMGMPCNPLGPPPEERR